MAIRAFPQLLAFLLLLLAGAALAQEPGNTSGPASGTNVKPSTAIQKENPGPPGSPNAAGAPGVEGKPGVQGGQANQGRATPQPPK